MSKGFDLVKRSHNIVPGPR